MAKSEYESITPGELQNARLFSFFAHSSLCGKRTIIHQRRLDTFADGEDLFETELLGTDFRTDVQKSFFERLDAQLNKVNKFYRSKEQEYMNWASQLQKQIGPLCQKRKGTSHRKVEDASAEVQSPNLKRVGMAVTMSENHQFGKVLRGSFTELYQGLGLLKDYCFLNLAAFGKILKKHDKITGQKVSNVYLRAVECSYFASSDRVTKLMEKVESLFIEHFTKGNRREALAYLKPTRQDNRVTVVFLLGLFSGTSVSLFTIFVLLGAMLHQGKLPAGSSYSQFDFRVFSTFALLFLHLYMYGFNVFIWQRVHINYAVILEFAPGKKLGFRDILLLSTTFTTIMLSGMVMQLVLYSTAAKTSVLPLTIMLVFFCLLLILPIDICCKSIRFTFLRHMWHIICSPLYQVTFSGFFLADQLTSQITALQNLAWILCYYICRHWMIKDNNACKESLLYDNFLYIVSGLPYWWRLMQCLRSWLDDGDQSHIVNGGKYLSALAAILTRLSFKYHDTREWLAAFVVASACATCYQLYWDVVVDWGLLQPNTINPWLRDSLVLRQRYVYFVSVGINTTLRLVWLFSVLHLQDNWIDHDVIDFLFASLEVFRRGLWNFFRLENEHLKNIAKYTAIKKASTLLVDLKKEIV
ncbi:hypothetical protein GOP47_0024597 [Adiantum capillus-veneris]|uniref:Uncharacterized protein n=1 Tax=Adiantum capillus-veneris TaxID=13818 RepID=A0A9D4U2Y4_ADICA|nr:hypothetical protein GOP47_0024597 [Adiantum capillus-veneris]